MPIQELDCKGLPCPQPVLRCKQCIEKDRPASFVVIVDNEPAKENVSRFLASQGYDAVEAAADGGTWRITATDKQAGEAAPQSPACNCEVMSDAELAQVGKQTICVFITAAVMGQGNDELGAKLMGNFVATLPELGDELWRIIMVNDGVKLATEGSASLEILQKLESQGVSILVCGTCLDFFGLLDKKQVGQTTNMLDVVTSLQLASKIIRP